MKHVIGVDLGTSAVKLLVVNETGEVVMEVSKPYPLSHPKSGWSEQDPNDWVRETVAGLSEVAAALPQATTQIEGISFSGQMHGLVLLDEQNEVLRPAILWNDTRTSPQCKAIYEKLGAERLQQLAKNPALEGFTLPKLMWVREHEPEVFTKAAKFVLPKDYVRLKLTGALHTDYSDAAGTLLLDIEGRTWSEPLCSAFGIDPLICPPLVESHACVGQLTEDTALATGLPRQTPVFAGGADNACGAVGAGILEDGKTLASIGTSGVMLSYQEEKGKTFGGGVHYFNHAAEDAFYTMGVTLAAGYSLSWFKQTFAPEETFPQLLAGVAEVPPGANGLLFTPYLAGERTPHADATIRASFIGADSSHTKADFTRAILEGITFSLRESLDLFREQGKTIERIVSIGGGVKSETWLQMQADIFQTPIVKQTSEQGPGMGAAMLAAYGAGWFGSLKECAEAFIKQDAVFEPDCNRAKTYETLYELYKQVYPATAAICKALSSFRK
ncbi:xylulokinase [Shouchella clausii]|uniref:xylulokinase n=1 Tax=Shouchella clausii TaxID=79880 RepID=UPI00280B8A98|nr:xylulokinase [Shouchella clausii]WMM33123.1 xylulokinase [Shouchella clausii]